MQELIKIAITIPSDSAFAKNIHSPLQKENVACWHGDASTHQ